MVYRVNITRIFFYRQFSNWWWWYIRKTTNIIEHQRERGLKFFFLTFSNTLFYENIVYYLKGLLERNTLHRTKITQNFIGSVKNKVIMHKFYAQSKFSVVILQLNNYFFVSKNFLHLTRILKKFAYVIASNVF
jgi:hypothetical protein